MKRTLISSVTVCAVMTLQLWTVSAQQQLKAVARNAPTPPWDKGIVPVTSESYWNAVECGKQGGGDPPCVFWDTGLCKNSDFALTFYTGYKAVAYEVWNAVRAKQPAPTPNYVSAQRTNVTIGVTLVAGTKNALTDLVLKRGGKPAVPREQSLSNGGGRFTYDYAPFAPTGELTMEMMGRTGNISCLLTQAVLTQLR